MTDTSLPVQNISSPRIRIFDIKNLHNYHRVTWSVVPSSRRPSCPFIQIYYLVHYSLDSSSHRPVVPSSRRSVVPSSRRPVVPSSRHPVVLSSRCPVSTHIVKCLLSPLLLAQIPIHPRPAIPFARKIRNWSLITGRAGGRKVLSILKGGAEKGPFKGWGYEKTITCTLS